MKRLFFVLLALIFGRNANAQVVVTQPLGKSIFNTAVKRDYSRKGNWFAYWGYNFSWYDQSNLNFKGPGYDFTLKDIVAHNRPSKLSLDYINPAKITVPQFDVRLGYYFKDNYSISLGWDHMKYVMDIPQKVLVNGYINPEISSPTIKTGSFAGTYHDTELNVTEDMLTFEHTDGFNYVSSEIERYDDIWVSKSMNNTLTLETGVGAGFMIPRSDVRLFGVGENNYWNFAGYGVSFKAGLKFYVTHRFYFQNTTKIGYTDMWAIHTTGRNAIDRANQKINYLENMTVLGFQFR